MDRVPSYTLLTPLAFTLTPLLDTLWLPASVSTLLKLTQLMHDTPPATSW